MRPRHLPCLAAAAFAALSALAVAAHAQTQARPGVPALSVAARPDLTIKRAFLVMSVSSSLLPATLQTVQSVRAGRPFFACMLIENRGPGAAQGVRTSGARLGGVTPVQAAYVANFSGGGIQMQPINAVNIAAGREAQLCLYYVRAPQAGRHRLMLEVDPANAVAETREDNNSMMLALDVGP
jgi:hypothetical protein